MMIKEVSEKYHITQDTLRYYERVCMQLDDQIRCYENAMERCSL